MHLVHKLAQKYKEVITNSLKDDIYSQAIVSDVPVLHAPGTYIYIYMYMNKYVYVHVDLSVCV